MRTKKHLYAQIEKLKETKYDLENKISDHQERIDGQKKKYNLFVKI